MVDIKAVDSTKESQRLWLQVDGSLEEIQTVALVVSGRLFGRELHSSSEVVGSVKDRTSVA